jgi:hypothetical protein
MNSLYTVYMALWLCLVAKQRKDLAGGLGWVGELGGAVNAPGYVAILSATNTNKSPSVISLQVQGLKFIPHTHTVMICLILALSGMSQAN